MTTATTPTRVFQLEKYGLVITITQKTDAHGTVHSFWGVTYNGRSVKTGLLEREHPLPEILKHIADNTTMRTDTGNMMLRGLTWDALNGCEHVPASELRAGDRMIVGGVAAHTVQSVRAHSDGYLFVDFEARVPMVRRFPPAHLCNLIERETQP